MVPPVINEFCQLQSPPRPFRPPGSQVPQSQSSWQLHAISGRRGCPDRETRRCCAGLRPD